MEHIGLTFGLLHVSGGMIRAACIKIACFLPRLMGNIFNVDFLENEIVVFDKHLTVAL